MTDANDTDIFAGEVDLAELLGEIRGNAVRIMFNRRRGENGFRPLPLILGKQLPVLVVNGSSRNVLVMAQGLQGHFR